MRKLYIWGEEGVGESHKAREVSWEKNLHECRNQLKE